MALFLLPPRSPQVWGGPEEAIAIPRHVMARDDIAASSASPPSPSPIPAQQDQKVHNSVPQPQPPFGASQPAEFSAMDWILKPYRLATSKPAQKTYLNTVLFVITSAILLALATVAYLLFYYSYVPQTSIEKIVHLQYGDGPHPYGITTLDSSLVSQQPYDISLTLSLPRSPPNLKTGNFMLSLSLLSPSYKPPLARTIPLSIQEPGPSSTIDPSTILHISRRPAILSYESPLISYSSRLAALPLYILGLRKEAETLSIPMAESTEFAKGWKNIPNYVLLELQAGQDVQVYDVRVHFTARFGGLRWLMYNYRLLSFIGFTTAFWLSEVLFTIFAWAGLRTIFNSSPTGKTGGIKPEDGETEDSSGNIIKKEEPLTEDEPDLSDTPRTFPTYGRQQPLRYVPKVKDEGDSEEYVLGETIQPLTGVEADDEEDLDAEFRGGFRDSGVGTSFSDASRGVTRRRSRGGKGA